MNDITPGSSLLPLRKLRDSLADEQSYTLPTRTEALLLLDIAAAAHRANFDAPCQHCSHKPEECPNTRLRDLLSRVNCW